MTKTYHIINHTTGEILQFDLAQGKSLWSKVAEYVKRYCWAGCELTIKEGAAA